MDKIPTHLAITELYRRVKELETQVQDLRKELGLSQGYAQPATLDDFMIGQHNQNQGNQVNLCWCGQYHGSYYHGSYYHTASL